MIQPDDPRVTAYALDEAGPDERRLVEAAMAADPRVAEAVTSVRAAAASLARALAAQAVQGLTSAQRASILRAPAAAPADRLVLPAWRRWGPFLTGAAAAGLILAGVARLRDAGGGRPTASSGTEQAAETAQRPRVAERVPSASRPTAAPESGAKAEGGWARGRGAEAASGAVPSGLREPSDPAPPAAPSVLPPGDPGVMPGLQDLLSRAQPSLELGGGAGAPAGTAPPFAGYVGPPVPVPTTPSVPAAGALLPSGPTIPVADASKGARRGFDVGLVPSGPVPGESRQATEGEAYEEVAASPFVRVADAPLSTFSVDVDTASYANVRRMLRDGVRPPAGAVRVEEMVNYFRYADPAPTGEDPFAVRLEAATCPWNAKHRLVRVALKGREVARAARPAMNLVFLVDVSGSMDHPAKLPLVQASLRMLLEELQERDTVALVVYAGSSGLVLPPTSCEQKATIQTAIDRLRAGGSTNGGAGIQLAYDTARSAYVAGGVNRVVLATDGDFNVGITSHAALLDLIRQQAKSRIFLTCLGYGMGNLKDATLEMLADKGNGNYGYVDSTREARKLLVEDVSGTLVTIAKDVKLQVEFNPRTVAAYRLVGYDNRRLADRDFADDTKDAGEVGAGHSVTALYEVVPVGVGEAAGPTPGVEPLRYGPAPSAPAAPARDEGTAGEMLVVKLRWKAPEGEVSVKREFPFRDAGAEYARASADFQFAAAVAAFAQVLADHPDRGTATLEAVAELATAGLGDDPGGYRAEFLTLVAAARGVVPHR